MIVTDVLRGIVGFREMLRCRYRIECCKGQKKKKKILYSRVKIFAGDGFTL